MIREIVKDTFFLSQKSEPATRQDQPVYKTCWIRFVPTLTAVWVWRRI